MTIKLRLNGDLEMNAAPKEQKAFGEMIGRRGLLPLGEEFWFINRILRRGSPQVFRRVSPHQDAEKADAVFITDGKGNIWGRHIPAMYSFLHIFVDNKPVVWQKV